MGNANRLRRDNPNRLTVKSLICNDMGYCCLWAFFTKYKQTGLIAARLGVTDRAIRKHKADFREGFIECENRSRCMKRSVKL